MTSKNLLDFVEVYKGAIPVKICEQIVSKSYDWQLHQWVGYNSKTESDKIDDPDMVWLDGMGVVKLQPSIDSCIEKYCVKHKISLQGHNQIRLNRYNVGTLMSKHHDHIYSLFSGAKKGIPILTALGLLNTDFQGGDFILFDDYKVELGLGDILIFPSIFLYPHRVSRITQGVRHSFVQWYY